jgi:mannose-6-phosphate isomerase-like protein (cupin superfamily)
VEAHDLSSLLERQAESGRPYLEYVRHPTLSVGLYVLEAGGVDRQGPHTEDEVYHVLAGRSRMTVGDEQREIVGGDTIFVAAGVPHRFHDIEEDLRIIVFFAPAEASAG